MTVFQPRGGVRTSRSKGLQASLPLKMLRSWDFLNHGEERINPILRHAEQGPVNSSLRNITLCHPEQGPVNRDQLTVNSSLRVDKQSQMCDSTDKNCSRFTGNCSLKRKVAFTLAEVLITLGIIGVVAAITLPALIDSVTERKNSERHANIVYKVTQAMDIMKAHGELSGRYETTEAFVDELQKYLKISKRCDSNHIADCWPTDKVIDAEGNEFEVSKAKTGKNLSLNSTTNNVGLILGDGAPIILNYNPDGVKVDETDALTAVKKSLPVGGGRTKEFVFTSNSTGSIDFVTDVNGSAAPNSETRDNKYNDIRNLFAATFSKGCAGEDVSGIGCVVDTGQQLVWQDAKDKCTSLGMTLPDKGTLKNIASKGQSNPNLPSGWLWSSSETDAYYAWVVYFASGSAGEGVLSKRSNQLGVLCVGN
ncbi:MAG: hypothetical protein VZR53_18220 [Prevotella sp.]|nr:hypothetical protein [Prevotella sp.]